MSKLDTPTTQGRPRPVLFGAIGVALISTAAAYVAMTGFGRDILHMSAGNAYAFAGVFELSLVTVALMAREAAQQDRPAQTLLSLTWVLSAASGTFAAMHELHQGHGPVAAAFRFTVPLLAALMWHLALIGDRHLAMERSWSEMRSGARLNAMMQARVERQRALEAAKTDHSRRARRRLERANARWEKVEALALRTVPPAQMRRHTAEWVDSFEAVRDTREPADRFALEQPRATPGPAVSEISAMSDTSDKALATPAVTPAAGGDTLAIAGGDTGRGVTPAGDDTTGGDTEGDTGPVAPVTLTGGDRQVSTVTGDSRGDTAAAEPGSGAVVTPEPRRELASMLDATQAAHRAVSRVLEAGDAGSTLHEATGAEEMAGTLAGAFDAVITWTKTLEERLAATDWSTRELDDAVAGLAEVGRSMGDPQPLVEATAQLRTAAEGALSVGESAEQVRAHGRTERFGAAGVTPTGGVTPSRPGSVTRRAVTSAAAASAVTPADVTPATVTTRRSASGTVTPGPVTGSVAGRGAGSARSVTPGAASAAGVAPAPARGATSDPTPSQTLVLGARAAELAEAGLTRQQIADELGVSKRTVQRYLREQQ